MHSRNNVGEFPHGKHQVFSRNTERHEQVMARPFPDLLEISNRDRENSNIFPRENGPALLEWWLGCGHQRHTLDDKQDLPLLLKSSTSSRIFKEESG